MASGGTITRVNQDIIHTFTASGSFVCDFYGTVELLVVAGGGGGGSHVSGGGGGGGGVLYQRSVSVSPQTYTITVGGGGGQSTNGGNSVALGYTAIGGGGGGTGAWNAGTNGAAGGSGGGASGEYYVVKTGGAGTANQGNVGGNSRVYTNSAYAGGGGGGSAGVGGASIATSAGNGGAGYACEISGSLQYYGAGGGGSTWREAASTVTRGMGGSGVGGNGGTGGNLVTACTAGATNTGSGGGGGEYGGCSGAAGIVIIRYNSVIVAPDYRPRELITLPLYKDPSIISYFRMDSNSNDDKGVVTSTDYNITYGVGMFSNRASFNGTSSRIDLSNSTAYDVQRLTIAAWVYSANFVQNGFIFEKGSVNTQYSLFFEGDYINFRLMYPGFTDYGDVSTYCRLEFRWQ